MLTFLQCGPLPELAAGALIQVLVNLHANQEELQSADCICPCHIVITEVNNSSQFRAFMQGLMSISTTHTQQQLRT